MKFSIVTPNYNYGRFLTKALESVLAQVNDAASGGASSPGEHKNDAGGTVCDPQNLQIEHIVIDGGSTDDSVQILERWDSFVRGTAAAKESRYSFQFVSEPDNGQTDAINKGLRRATGDIVAWLNADEYYLPGKLALVADCFDKHPDADFVYGEPLFVDKDGNPIRVKRDHPFSRFVLLYYGCHISSCASFWRRKVQSEGGIYLDPSFKVTMDYEYYCNVCRAGYGFRFVPATIAAFVWHDSNISATFNDRRLDEEFRVWSRYLRLPGSEKTLRRFLIPAIRKISHQFHRLLILYRMAMFSKDDLG